MPTPFKPLKPKLWAARLPAPIADELFLYGQYLKKAGKLDDVNSYALTKFALFHLLSTLKKTFHLPETPHPPAEDISEEKTPPTAP
jgi:hypothetical protein